MRESASAVERPDDGHRRLALALVAIFALALLSEPLWNWQGRALPGNVGIDAVLASDSDFGLSEGCEAATYRLSQATVNRLAEQGIAYLARNAAPRGENPRNRYQGWRETLVGVDLRKNGAAGTDTIQALYAMGGCGSRGRDFHSRELTAALSEPGSYYALTANREGILIVAPRQRLAAYFYFG